MSYEIMVFKHMQKVSCKPSNTIIKQLSYSHLIFLVSTPLKVTKFQKAKRQKSSSHRLKVTKFQKAKRQKSSSHRYR